ncbi:NADP-dependent oxidoreductase domain-containing protein 1 [Suncus etruscus]|uniref:NADP-dependent oxidoreductase domain-containing protein 1 n=1 Tax=Suncus etruscus TaxID=109475 RepID=UPI0021107BE6|nr:NADP-dependent oxidoreductase domain-containing protein 1 [Suncus etruscus]
MELLGNLKSLEFDYGIPEEDRGFLCLRNHSRGLTICACAHAVFFCKLLYNLRELLYEMHISRTPVPSNKLANTVPEDSKGLKVGIIGGGCLGRQLAHVLLQLVPISAESLRISTRRPEALDELQKLGVQCFYQNSNLVHWANLIFLCCLPSQLPNICVEISNSLEKACIIYSFVAAVPITRLKLLLNHTNVLRPQYQCSSDVTDFWGSNKDIPTALQDPMILQATCPYCPAGGITLNLKWLEGVMYALINSCRGENIFYRQVLLLLKKVLLSAHGKTCEQDQETCPTFQLHDFVNKVFAENLSQKSSFPWFDLTAVQLKETPLTHVLSTSNVLRDHLTYTYCHLFGITLIRAQQPVDSKGASS